MLICAEFVTSNVASVFVPLLFDRLSNYVCFLQAWECLGVLAAKKPMHQDGR
jgi:hypothetical protein